MEPLRPCEPFPQQLALTLERAGMVGEVGLVCIYCVNPTQRCCQGQAAPCAAPLGTWQHWHGHSHGTGSQLSERHEGHVKI